MPELSIIVTSYNIEQYLDQCLAGITGQTLDDLEIIVVDDGSTDRSPAIIKSWAEKDDRIVPVLLPENSPGGVATAANAGLDRATAPYVGFADGDDVYEPHMFATLLDAAKSGGCDLAMCMYQVLDESTGELSDPAETNRWTGLELGRYELDEEGRKRFLKFISVPWRKIYRREVLEANDIRFPVGDYFFEDNPFHWFTVLTANAIAIVPEVLCYHRVARLGQTMATADERLFRIFSHHDTIHSWLADRGLLEKYDTTLLAWVLSQVEWIAPRTEGAMQMRLYEIVQPIFAEYDPVRVDAALAIAGKGVLARELGQALVADDRAAYSRYLSSRRRPPRLPERALHHLRTGGVRHAAQVGRRYTSRHLDRAARVITQRVPRRRTASQFTNRDLMFALIVLQRRLDAIERRLDESSAKGEPGEPSR